MPEGDAFLSAVCRQPAPRPLRAGSFSTEQSESRSCRWWREGRGHACLTLTRSAPLVIPHRRRVWNDVFMKESSIKTRTSATACMSRASPPYKMLTCTSGCRLEVWLNRTWIAGHVESDGEDYWLFADGGGRFLLAEHMKARYTEHHWQSGVRDISGICSSSSIRIIWEKCAMN